MERKSGFFVSKFTISYDMADIFCRFRLNQYDNIVPAYDDDSYSQDFHESALDDWGLSDVSPTEEELNQKRDMHRTKFLQLLEEYELGEFKLNERIIEAEELKQQIIEQQIIKCSRAPIKCSRAPVKLQALGRGWIARNELKKVKAAAVNLEQYVPSVELR